VCGAIQRLAWEGLLDVRRARHRDPRSIQRPVARADARRGVEAVLGVRPPVVTRRPPTCFMRPLCHAEGADSATLAFIQADGRSTMLALALTQCCQVDWRHPWAPAPPLACHKPHRLTDHRAPRRADQSILADDQLTAARTPG
jgi:hypothetical protein